ncbi:hypothetical protein [Actinoplanes siamensis]|uniref:Nucleic acid binding protein n=1 Tax=Actinoplanes siamensis TaxID=1223317 RepID=A0A919TMY3_9ACTN|nr:hypothetical protein [Actinoplanes siamensis]GIF07495.1 hypothetical protein Asi03nite_50330 [Actinoplanes siamensis]
MIRRTVVPAALLLLTIGGCANAPDQTGSSGSVPSAPVASSPIPELTMPSKPVLGSTTSITGTVVAGVEPNCLLLQEQNGTHLLVFRDDALRASARPGSKVRVTGAPQPGMMTTCQQGEPFLVSAVTPG